MPAPKVRVRFAPSPTGYLHIGGLRTALYNYLLARQAGGSFVLRIEDTDRTRFVPDALSDIVASLAWAGLSFDEGPGVDGPHAPYFQSERGPLYLEAAERLLAGGDAYLAFDTPEELERLKDELRGSGVDAWSYGPSTRPQMRNSLSLPESETARLKAEGRPFVVRMKVPESGTIGFDDLIRGRVEIAANQLDDQVLIKSDGMPTYHLANVVDDHLMEITHVIRGEEWLPSTPKHLLLYASLGWEPPRMAHMPLILSPTGGKLSKRNAEEQDIPVSVRQYMEAGYEPEALVNYLALLGWNPGSDQELFTLEELVEAFDIGRVGSAGIQFDLDKLDWHNAQFLRSLPVSALADRVAPTLPANVGPVSRVQLEGAARLMQERVTFAREIITTAPYLFHGPSSYDPVAVASRWKESSASTLKAFGSTLEDATGWDEAALEQATRSYVAEAGLKMGELMAPLRIALTGTAGGPAVYAMMALFGKEETLGRIRSATTRLADQTSEKRPSSQVDSHG